MLYGAAGAILLRVILIAFAVTIMNIPFLKLVGALLLLWIGIKLIVPQDEGSMKFMPVSVFGVRSKPSSLPT